MENNENKPVETVENTENTETVENTETETVENTETETVENTETTEETVTMSKKDFDKKIQSEVDKVRSEYSRQLNELKKQIPEKKTEEQIALETRAAELDAKEKAFNFKVAMNEKGVASELQDFIKLDCDVEAFATVYESAIQKAVDAYVKENGYVPENHKSGTTMTKEEFAKLPMSEKERIHDENPTLYNSLVARRYR